MPLGVGHAGKDGSQARSSCTSDASTAAQSHEGSLLSPSRTPTGAATRGYLLSLEDCLRPSPAASLLHVAGVAPARLLSEGQAAASPTQAGPREGAVAAATSTRDRRVLRLSLDAFLPPGSETQPLDAAAAATASPFGCIFHGPPGFSAPPGLSPPLQPSPPPPSHEAPAPPPPATPQLAAPAAAIAAAVAVNVGDPYVWRRRRAASCGAAEGGLRLKRAHSKTRGFDALCLEPNQAKLCPALRLTVYRTPVDYEIKNEDLEARAAACSLLAFFGGDGGRRWRRRCGPEAAANGQAIA